LRVAQPRSVVTSRRATTAAWRASPTIPAATAIARSVRAWRGAQWLAARQAELLAVPYFHVVFTLPAPIAAIAFQNKAVVYAILFAASAEAMTTLAASPRRLGAQIGVVAVLHTWGQTLTHHPHVHCVAPGGGISPDGTRWVAGRPNFFLAVKPLSACSVACSSNACEPPSTRRPSASSAISRICPFQPYTLPASRVASTLAHSSWRLESNSLTAYELKLAGPLDLRVNWLLGWVETEGR
jgi:hypothetical protein